MSPTHYSGQINIDCKIVDGVVRWISNDRVPFDDVLCTLPITPEQRAASNVAREAETAAFLAEWRTNPPEVTEEQRTEARAAFGPGVRIVDVITGRSYTT